jgi:sortase (surface protein transpeptidase)
LAVPADIYHTGWWIDGAAPGDTSGTVLIAGHVDSAALGAGAFFPLVSATSGTIVAVSTRSGRSVRYRVTRAQTILKADLPLGIFTRTGAPRLVLVTCGGPFAQRTGHYIDNVIV